jgi:hypothetical protein
MMRSLRLLVLAACTAPTLAAAQEAIAPAPYPEVQVQVTPPPVAVVPPRAVMPPPAPYYTPRPRVYYAPPPPAIVYPSAGAMPPHIYIRERIRWHLRRFPRVVVVAPPPPVVYAQPAPPAEYAPPPVPAYPPVPPPVVVPPPCCYGAPAPSQELVLVTPRPQVPMWSSRVGLGIRGTGQVINDGWNNLGIGGEFLYRVSPHLSTELAAEYQRSTGSESHLDRVDIPVTLGLRVHIGRPTWVVSPYFVFAAGVGYASQDLKFTTDDAVYVDGQIGGGLELRLGQHFAVTADARLDAKKRANSVADNVLATTSIDGKPVHALGDEVGGQFRLGVAAYF